MFGSKTDISETAVLQAPDYALVAAVSPIVFAINPQASRNICYPGRHPRLVRYTPLASAKGHKVEEVEDPPV